LKDTRLMASINDNLFTILLQLASPYESGFRLSTHWGPLTARFSGKGLSQLFFDDSDHKIHQASNQLSTAFLQWLKHYQTLRPAKQWQYLTPTGTAFQKSVWRALIEISYGERTSYHTIAQAINKPKANRAVGSAVGANPISLLIPCHRIIQASGAIGNYRWGVNRKCALLDAEQQAGSDLRQLFT